MYVIAEYKINGGENEIEIVPGSWYDESAQTCWWPPSTFTFSQINHHVLKKTPHNPKTWISYEADIIATFS